MLLKRSFFLFLNMPCWLYEITCGSDCELVRVLNPMIPKGLDVTLPKTYNVSPLHFKGCFYHPCWHLFQSCHFHSLRVGYTDRWMKKNSQEVLVSSLRLGCSQGLLLSCMGWDTFSNNNNNKPVTFFYIIQMPKDNSLWTFSNKIDASNRLKCIKIRTCWDSVLD